MAKTGRPKKIGPRKPCGRLAAMHDEGHELVLDHREREFGAQFKHRREIDYVIGQLYLARAFQPRLPDDADTKTIRAALDVAQQRHDIGVEFATLHHLLYGPGTAPSHLRDLVGMRRRQRSVAGERDPLARAYAKYRIWYAAAMIVPPGRARLLGHQVLERAALYEMPPQNPAELELLIRVFDRLRELRGAGGARRTPGSRSPADKPDRATRRREAMLAIYSRERYGPDPEELAEALARFTALSGKVAG